MVAINPATAPSSKPLQIPNWAQRAQAIVGILGFPFVLMTNPDFRSWLFSRKFPLPPHVPPKQDPHLIVLHVMQAVIIFVVIFIHYFQLKDAEQKLQGAGPIARNTYQQFRASWMFMWSMWLVLYIWLLIRVVGPPSDWLDSVTDVFNTISGFAIWRCFLVLDMPSVNIQNEPNRDKPYRKAMRTASVVGLFCACLAPADRFLQLGHVGLAAVGLYGGLALACLVGRLGSHYINMPRWMLLFLYLYAMSQLFYSFFDILSPLWTWAVFGAVLVLKVMLAFAGVDMLKYGGLDRYLKAAESEFQMITS